MAYKSLRNTVGMASLTALALTMVACGGSSSSTPTVATNAGPSPAVVVGSTSGITLHPATYNLSAVDPENDQITFTVSGATTASVGPTNGSGSFVWTPTSTQTGAQVISVLAKDSGGHAAASTTNLTVNVAANRPPQFLSQDTFAFPAGSSATINQTYSVAAQDPDTDDVRYAITPGTASFVDNNGGTTGITGEVKINAVTGVVTFTGTVPSGATAVTATFTVVATDQLVGSGTVLGATSSQVVKLTYTSNNVAPVILTTSLPSLPLNHYIPVNANSAGFLLSATDANAGDVANLKWTMDPVTGLQLSSSATSLSTGTVTGASAYILTNSSWVPPTSLTTALSVKVYVTDPGGLVSTRTLSIPLVPDSTPTLNSNVYTETVSGVVAFDSSRVKNDLTGPTRSKFYPGNVDWTGFGQYNSYGFLPYLGAMESTGGIDSAATDNLFSNYKNAYPAGFLGALKDDTIPAAGWNARTIFKDNEGDAVTYKVLPGSVFVAGAPYNTVGQTFTLSPVTLPVLPGGSWGYGISPDLTEYPKVDANTGTIQWRPVLTSEIGFGFPVGLIFGTSSYPLTDNFNIPIWAEPSVWSFIVEANENVYVPAGNTAVAAPSNKGQQQYVIKVQPNNAPTIGALTTIPNATHSVAGAFANLVVNATSNIAIGGGASTSTTAYGRPSIQEPESRRYDVTTGTNLEFGGVFDYTKANTVKPAVWRWLMAMPGGDNTMPLTTDVEIYDADQTTTSGHMDSIFATMGEAVVPAADTTGNIPVLAAGSASFYNPWLTSGNAGAFQVNWGPNRIQYLIARVTASAAYSFPVEVRDQYERINNGELNINPIFGTVRFTNSRTRQLLDVTNTSRGVGAYKRGGTLASGANPGDPAVAGAVNLTPFTFTYLPFPADSGSGDEYYFDTFLLGGDHPASGTDGSGLYSAASWITLNAKEAPYTGYHTANPLNDETGTFNLPAYASAAEGTSSSTSRSDWKTYGYKKANAAAPTDPAVENWKAIGSWTNHEVRAQVIPSNSPYLFAFTETTTSAIPSTGVSAFYNNFPTELQGNTLQIERKNPYYASLPANVGPTGYWYNLPVANGGSAVLPVQIPGYVPKAHGWVYNLYQGEIDMQNAQAGRSVSLPSAFGSTTLRWTYSWPTQVTNANLGVFSVGGPNKWAKGDVMQIAVPNQSANARYFFVGDGSNNDPNKANIYGWGCYGISTTTGLIDNELVFGNATPNMGFWGLTAADNTPFHVPSDSLWVYNNFNGAGTTGFLNTPNRTTFSPGATSTQLPYSVGLKGYIDASVPGSFNVVNPGYVASFSGQGSIPAMIDLTKGDNVYFLWLKKDTIQPTAWGTWDASLMTSGSTYTATGELTTVPPFAMVNNATNSTLPASYLQDAQVSMATGSIPGQNHGANVNIRTDASLYNTNIINAQGWARSEWGLAAPTMGYQPNGSTNARLVNPKFDTTNPRFNNLVTDFRTTTASAVSYEGGVRDSAIVYGVRRTADESGVANAELGLAGIEPGSPLLAQWYNLQISDSSYTDPALDASTVANTQMADVKTSWPSVFNFYSPFTGKAEWANVLELKVNFLVGVTYPGATTLAKVPAAMVNVFPLGEAVTDPSNNTATHTINPGNPIVRPIQFLRVTDFVPNTTPGAFNTTLDLVTSDVSDMFGAGAKVLAGSSSTLNPLSNLKVTFQASVNNQVIPSGYVIDVFKLPTPAVAGNTDQPVLLGTVRAGHIGGQDAIQNVFLPSMHSYSGGTNEAYFFRVRTVWHKGVKFEKQPTKQGFPMGYADYISAPFVTR